MTADLRAILGDRYEAVIEEALTAVDAPEHGYQVTRGNVDQRDIHAALAAVLPDLLADAWDEGWNDCGPLRVSNAPDNPYRTETT